jgi:uncharacterized membrane protein YfcA
VRKYLLNGGVIGAVVGAWSVIQQPRKGPRNWILILVWISWGLSLAVAIGTVREKSKNLELEQR